MIAFDFEGKFLETRQNPGMGDGRSSRGCRRRHNLTLHKMSW